MDSKQKAIEPRRSDAVAAALLAIATACVVVWQNSRLTILWDLSYILENASRMAAGQVPYRDFPFPYAPLTFLVQAAIIRIAGRAIWHHVAYAAVAGGVATALAYFVVRRFTTATAALLLCLPLVPLGIYSIFPHPFYDPDACLVVLAVMAALLYTGSAAARFWIGFAAVVPLLVKQNIGLAFAIAMAGLVIVSRDRRRGVHVLTGLVAGCAAALLAVATVFGFDNYLRWTIHFAASRRLPPIRQYLLIYSEPIIWWWVAAAVGGVLLMRRFRWTGAAIIASPFVWTIYRIFVTDDPIEREVNLLRFWPMVIVAGCVAGCVWLWRERTLRGIVPLACAATILGAFLSQSDWGSTYGVWPMLIVLVAAGIGLAETMPRVEAALALAIAAALLAGGIPYVIGNERLTYVKLDGDLHRSSLPPLRGLRMAGEWLPEFEELVAWSDAHIAKDDAILSLPGEDLFYFTTGRTPRFPVLMFDRTINPFDAATLVRIAGERHVRWVIVKKRLQLNGTPMENLDETLRMLGPRLRVAAQLRNYTIYERR